MRQLMHRQQLAHQGQAGIEILDEVKAGLERIGERFNLRRRLDASSSSPGASPRRIHRVLKGEHLYLGKDSRGRRACFISSFVEPYSASPLPLLPPLCLRLVWPTPVVLGVPTLNRGMRGGRLDGNRPRGGHRRLRRRPGGAAGAGGPRCGRGDGWPTWWRSTSPRSIPA